MKNFLDTLFICSFLVLYSCGVTEYISGTDEIDTELTSDLDLELKSDELEEIMSFDNETSSTELSENKEDFSIEDSDQKLESSPVSEYDSVLIEDPNQETIIEEQKEEQVTLALPSFQKLELKDKIQYRIATINFTTGSSLVDYKGLKKIKKIVKLAKERDAKIKIVGHASKRTKDMPLNKHKLVNFSISHKRAQTVAKLVIEKYNFPSENLITEAVSDSKPLFREDMPAGSKANQRTEIFIIY